jgi:glucosamine--fructose-6-phosphate aminotransferase (isomerizing)
MCGIVGYVGFRNAVDFLVQGLRRLEYRGYDSAGVATIDTAGALHIVKREGRIERLEAQLIETPVEGHLGIGHTRWATHGPATDENAHPHLGGNSLLAVVHNGVIENFQTLKNRLECEGYCFTSATDSEVIAHLVASCLKEQGGTAEPSETGVEHLVAAVQAALRQLRGTYGLAIVFRDHPEVLIAARLGSPLIVGVGEGEYFVASDSSGQLHGQDRVSGRS